MADKLPLPNRLRAASALFHRVAECAANCGDYSASRWLYEQSERAETELAKGEAKNDR